MNILLIAPAMPGYTIESNYSFPMGMASISAVLKKAGHTVVCINTYHLRAPFEDELTDTVKSAASPAFDMVGIGGLSLMYPSIKAIAASVRKILPEAFLVFLGNEGSLYVLSWGGGKL